ncbi:hypothetical protein Pmani_018637 [Petrolisthes manimaculis]|uniref:Uncharacterized protein n=1 Tax=Petrolisthes manimaculis TaxID=1843537 RepID=A0AAE1PM41_9EUCA|nr:hypothetical protein Pmani_018637 [Petrolisthes manimaculis]
MDVIPSSIHCYSPDSFKLVPLSHSEVPISHRRNSSSLMGAKSSPNSSVGCWFIHRSSTPDHPGQNYYKSSDIVTRTMEICKTGIKLDIVDVQSMGVKATVKCPARAALCCTHRGVSDQNSSITL